MNNFWKTVLACILAIVLLSVAASTLWTISVAALTASMFSSKKVDVPEKSVLDINFSKLVIAEQTKESDFFESLQASPAMMSGDYEEISTVGILDAVNALEQAANDPRITLCYIRPDEAKDISHLEEFRSALVKFHESGKPIYAYIEHPTNAGYWLASAADRIFMSEYNGGMNMLVGINGQMMYFKDLLDKLGVNIQLIRHGKYKSAGEPFIRSTPSAENIEQQSAMINGLWKEMAGQMSQRGELTYEQFNALIDNLELSSPADFLSKGLVDETTGISGIKRKLCTAVGAEEFDDVKSVSFADYASATKVNNNSSDDKIAIVYADGEIVEGYGKEEVAGKRFAEMIDEIRDDDDIKGVVLRVNSPGGSVIASCQIKEAIDQLRAEKPVVASYGSYAASGGYWISANCDRIFSDATTLTGSIGVFGMIPDFSKTVKDVAHINVTNVGSNAHSDMYSLMRPLSGEEIAFAQKDIEAIYDQFTNLVAKGRNMDVQKVDELGQGRVWTGRDALANGLVDEIGGLKEALDYTAQITGCSIYKVKSYPKPLNTFEQLISEMNVVPDDHLVKIYKKIEGSKKVEVLARMPYSIEIR